MSSAYGPVDIFLEGGRSESYHVDAGWNLPSAVTLTSVLSSPTPVVQRRLASGAYEDVDELTVSDTEIVDGDKSGRTLQAIEYTVTCGATPPTTGGAGRVKIWARRSDGVDEPVYQRCTLIL